MLSPVQIMVESAYLFLPPRSSIESERLKKYLPKGAFRALKGFVLPPLSRAEHRDADGKEHADCLSALQAGEFRVRRPCRRRAGQCKHRGTRALSFGSVFFREKENEQT
jgi:hypothetical protein